MWNPCATNQAFEYLTVVVHTCSSVVSYLPTAAALCRRNLLLPVSRRATLAEGPVRVLLVLPPGAVAAGGHVRASFRLESASFALKAAGLRGAGLELARCARGAVGGEGRAGGAEVLSGAARDTRGDGGSRGAGAVPARATVDASFSGCGSCGFTILPRIAPDAESVHTCKNYSVLGLFVPLNCMTNFSFVL